MNKASGWISFSGFSPGGPIIKEGLKPLLGVVNDHTLYMDALVRIIRYFSLGMWLAVGAPWLFVKLKLAKRADYLLKKPCK